jgi:hypothetical protein
MKFQIDVTILCRALGEGVLEETVQELTNAVGNSNVGNSNEPMPMRRIYTTSWQVDGLDAAVRMYEQVILTLQDQLGKPRLCGVARLWTCDMYIASEYTRGCK